MWMHEPTEFRVLVTENQKRRMELRIGTKTQIHYQS